MAIDKQCSTSSADDEERRCRECGDELPAAVDGDICGECVARIAEHRATVASVRRMIAAGLPEFEFATGRKTLDTFQADTPSLENAKRVLRSFVDDERPHSLYIFGPPGVGKSFLAKAAAAEIVRRGSSSVRVTSARQIPIDLRRAMAEDVGADAELLEELAGADLLVVDDLGTADRTTAFAAEALLHVVDDRVRHQSRTIITGNYNLRSLAERLSESLVGVLIADRIRELCNVIEVRGASFRAREHARLDAIDDAADRREYDGILREIAATDEAVARLPRLQWI